MFLLHSNVSNYAARRVRCGVDFIVSSGGALLMGRTVPIYAAISRFCGHFLIRTPLCSALLGLKRLISGGPDPEKAESDQMVRTFFSQFSAIFPDPMRKPRKNFTKGKKGV